MRKTLLVSIIATTLTAFASPPALDAQQSGAQQPPQGQAGSRDDRIEDYIFVRLAERGWVGGDFTVNVKDGTATLTGTVPSEGAKARMGRIARRTVGVRDLKNNLQVNPKTAFASSPMGDDELAQRVARQIASEIPGAKSGEDWWLEGWRVEGPDNIWNFVVEAESGRVYLEGDVPRRSIIRKAVDAARQTPGVQSVRSDLEVDRFYGGYPYRFSRYPYPYGYHPYAYDPGHLVDDIDAMPDAGSKGGTLTGSVKSVDRERGRLTLETASGTTQLTVPPSTLDGVQQGQQVTVQVDVSNPRTGSPKDMTQ